VVKLLICLGLLGLAPVASHALVVLPDNPIAIGNCTATVKVDAARLRSAPSLDAKVLGIRLQSDSLYVTKVIGKWVQVVLPSGDTAYIAAYLLSFPPNELLEQWKRDNPSPSVGKKAKTKWAAHFRKYPSAQSPNLGHFAAGDEVAVLSDLGNGWSLVEGRKADGKGPCFGFIANRALGPPDLPDPALWSAPLARVRVSPGEAVDMEKRMESPTEYCRRTAWSPELFAMEMRAKAPSPARDPLGPSLDRLIAQQAFPSPAAL
jgi:hypothetical protein